MWIRSDPVDWLRPSPLYCLRFAVGPPTARRPLRSAPGLVRGLASASGGVPSWSRPRSLRSSGDARFCRCLTPRRLPASGDGGQSRHRPRLRQARRRSAVAGSRSITTGNEQCDPDQGGRTRRHRSKFRSFQTGAHPEQPWPISKILITGSRRNVRLRQKRASPARGAERSRARPRRERHHQRMRGPARGTGA